MPTLRHAVPAAVACALLAAPLTASADIISVYAAAKADWVAGTGDVYERFDADIGYGALLGFELVGVDFWGEALIMGQDQYMFTGNIGVDLSFGDDLRFNLGVDTGPLVFHFPEQDVRGLVIPGFLVADPGVNQSTARSQGKITQEEARAYEDEYDDYIELEKEVSQWAFGWNLARARLSLEFALVPSVLYLGVGGHVGYHYLINGEDAAADVKSVALDQLESEHPDAADLGVFRELRKSIGAKSIDKDNLHGLNYNVGAFLKVEF